MEAQRSRARVNFTDMYTIANFTGFRKEIENVPSIKHDWHRAEHHQNKTGVFSTRK